MLPRAAARAAAIAEAIEARGFRAYLFDIDPDPDPDGGGRFAPVLASGEQPPFHDF